MKCVVFAPGYMGTALKNVNGLVWPPTMAEIIGGYSRIDQLLAADVRTHQIISASNGVGVYRSLLRDISACGYSETSADRLFLPFPYDWRRSNVDSAGKLANVLDATFKHVPDDLEITFLSHSMGGLVMRHLLESGSFNTKPWFGKITRLITMGTPHQGSPAALEQLVGRTETLGISGSDFKRMANDPKYPSVFELVPPASTAMLTGKPLPGELPKAMDPFGHEIANALNLNPNNIAQARAFWKSLKPTPTRPEVDYFYFVGAAHQTIVGNVFEEGSTAPAPVLRSTSGDGLVPISSAVTPNVPHAFCSKQHVKLFNDRSLRKQLYQFLDAPVNAYPLAEDPTVAVGAKDALGISLNKHVYEQNEEIEITLSYNGVISAPEETFELFALDQETGVRTPRRPQHFTIKADCVAARIVTLSIKPVLNCGVYGIKSVGESDDPEPNVFLIRKRMVT